MISRYWGSHHRIFRVVNGFDDRLLVIDMFFLPSAVIHPLPTTLLGNYTSYRYAVMSYGATLLLPGLIVLLLLLWLYAARRGRLMRVGISTGQLRSLRWRMSLRPLVPPVVFGISPLVAMSIVISAVLMWAALGPLFVALGRLLCVERGVFPDDESKPTGQ